MGLYQRCLQNDGMLVCVHEEPAAEVDFLLPDLNSRMRSLMHFAMSPLDDEDKAELLKHRAKMRGYELDDRVIHYWLTRGPRDVSRLLVDLDALDRASLSHQKKVTIALLKQVLGY